MVCVSRSVLLLSWKGLSEVYNILQTTLLSWDTDGDGVVEFHEVVGALKAAWKIIWSRIRHCKKSQEGFGGRTIEWRAALCAAHPRHILSHCLNLDLLAR